jgi:hypothetical protein
MCLTTVDTKPNKKIKNGFKVFIYENNKICGLYWSYYKLNRIKYTASKLYCDKNIKEQVSGISVKPYPQGQWISVGQTERLLAEIVGIYDSGFHFFETIKDAVDYVKHYHKAIKTYTRQYRFACIEEYLTAIFAIETKQIIASGTQDGHKCHVAKRIKIGEQVQWEIELT